ncbi:MAG: radical SAM/SPASM domain-containing protein [Bacteroidales bacterium]
MLKRLLLHTDRKCLYKFVYNLGIKGALGYRKFQRRLRKGEFFPAFHFISVTDDCNLNCQGCWVTGKKENARMDPEQLHRIITETKAMGSYFFGILGGEPLMYKPLIEVLKRHPDCYFQLFTNGTLLTPGVAEQLRKLGNVSPLISFEGDEAVADIRRGGKDVYRKTQEAVSNATNAGLITGVAMSVCRSNLNLALSDDFVVSLVKKGVTYLWYYIYRPVGEQSSVELSLSAEEILKLRRYMVDARNRFDIILIDAYWDGEGRGLCPAASGLSHHINASGYIEPCPVIQFATDHINGGRMADTYNRSEFLKALRTEIPAKTSGCVVMDDPQWLVEFVKKHKATDTSGRGNEAERLLFMPKVPSHGSGTPVPEKSRMYKFAKRKAFFGLGAYG